MTQSYQEIKCSYIVCVAKGIGSLTTCKGKGKIDVSIERPLSES